MPLNNNALGFVFVDPSRQISRKKLLEEIQLLKLQDIFLRSRNFFASSIGFSVDSSRFDS
ncbi:21033_t:CDS:2 [Dentiscutata erythropus]|uniref:21033_t:CDS:1 n=1 Tax=Dentiscutata erythropus TaxID=1348616 RepID=A0A9N9KFT2_9GLOM|nr:21033_t:CDS:2 [Dentiscutata erythropus]